MQFRTLIFLFILTSLSFSSFGNEQSAIIDLVSRSLDSVNGPFKYSCGVESKEVIDCPYLVEQFSSDTSTGLFFQLISDSPWNSCNKYIKTSSKDISLEEFENDLSNEPSRDLGIRSTYFTTQIGKCFDSKKKSAQEQELQKKSILAMSYNYLNKIKSNTNTLSKEIVNINSLLSEDLLTDLPCDEFNMPHDSAYCLSVKSNNCKTRGGLGDLSTELYINAIEPIHALSLKIKEIKKRYAGRGGAVTKRKKISEIKNIIEFIKAENPLLQGSHLSKFIDDSMTNDYELPSMKDFKNHMKVQLKDNKSILQSKLKRNIKMNNCILYGDSSECDDFDEDLAEIPYQSTPMAFSKDEIQTKDNRKKQMAREQLYQVPECMDRSRNLKNEFNSFALNLSVNVGLTVATGGAALALRAGQLGKAALAAKAVTLGADAAFLSTGVIKAIDSCNKHLNGMKKISKSSNENICPISLDNPGFIKTSNVLGCVSAALLASVDALPFVPSIASRATRNVAQEATLVTKSEKRELDSFVEKLRNGDDLTDTDKARYLLLLQKSAPLENVMRPGIGIVERAFTKNALQKMYKKEYLSAKELFRLSKNLKPRNPPLVIVTAQNDMSKIMDSKRLWGQSEGRVYGTQKEIVTKVDRIKSGVHDAKEGTVVFSGDTAALFKNHDVHGAWSGMKNSAGQQRGPFGDIVIEEFKREIVDGKLVLVVTKARRAAGASHSDEVLHAGQSTLHARSKEVGRMAGLDAGIAASAGFYTWLYTTDNDELKDKVQDKLFYIPTQIGKGYDALVK
jgi:hypothetical protein